MVKRTKKPAITSEVRLDWLRRYEEEKESPPKIAKKDKVDVRTVRRHIGLAKEQRETRDARATVLRNALENHYQDILRFAETLEQEVSGVGRGSAIKDAEFLEVALRQHLPRSPIWSELPKLKKLREERLEQPKIIENRVTQEAESNPETKTLIQTGLKGIVTAVSLLMIQQVDFWLQGNPVQDLKGKLFTNDPAEKGQVGLRLRGAFIGQVRENEVKNVEKVIENFVEGLQKRLRESSDFQDMEKTTSEMRRTHEKLREELAIIRLRHVVPGRCKFCPPW